MENEIWRPIKGFEGQYEVSNMGQVRSLYRSNQYGHKVDNIKIKKQALNRNYYRVSIKDKLYYVAVLVAKAFPEICGKWFEGAQVNHKNEITTDNRAENLEWCTPSYNSSYGTRQERIKVQLKNFGKAVFQLSKNGDLVNTYRDIFEVKAKNPQYSMSYIESVLKGDKHRHTAYGYKWIGGSY